MITVGVLALQGGVAEHMAALKDASRKAKIECTIKPIRTAAQMEGLDAIVLPGGESTTISKLLVRNGMMEKMRAMRAIFGTCAGLILMAKEVDGAEKGQQFIGVMDVKVARNAYGSQIFSFEHNIGTSEFGKLHVIFIRPPKIISTGVGVDVLANVDGVPVIIVQKTASQFLLGASFHPELTTTKVHEYFLKEVAKLV
jgi:pyridoxal 5'-phosphate synthase pdxT subunit